MEIDEKENAYEMLQSAMKYLKPRADADEHDQEIGDFEAWTILSNAAYDIALAAAHLDDCNF